MKLENFTLMLVSFYNPDGWTFTLLPSISFGVDEEAYYFNFVWLFNAMLIEYVREEKRDV